jgi:hypothetical protein
MIIIGMVFTLMLSIPLSFAIGLQCFSAVEPSDKLNVFSDMSDTKSANSNSVALPSAAVAHNPVLIVGNISSFTPKTGTGVIGNPFIIENLQISGLGLYSGSNYAFLLKDTSEYVIIRNIIIEDISGSKTNIRIFAVVNCSHVTVENFTIQDCEPSTGTTGFIMYLKNSVNLVFNSVTVTKYSQNLIYGAWIENCNNSRFQDISVIDVDSAFWISWYMLNCRNIYCKNLQFSNIRSSTFSGFPLFGTDTDIIIEDSIIDHIYSTSSIVFYQSSATSNNCTIRRCNFLNSITGQINSNYFQGIDHQFINNIVRNITATTTLNMVDIWNINNLNVTGNIIDSLTSETSDVMCFNFFTSSVENLVYNNRVSNLSAPEGESYAVYSRVGAISNRIWNNWFFSGSIPAFDNGANFYSGLVYIPSLGVEITLGNYWYDHNYDGDQAFHYWINTPRLIDGNGNLSDPRPIHYFMMDFDSDGLMNFDENKANCDIWDPDSDNDGLSDGFEVNVLGTNPNLSDTDNDGISDGVDPEPLVPEISFMDSLSEFVKEPLNDLLLGIVALLVINMFLLLKRTKPNKPVRQSNRETEDIIEESNSKLETSKSQSKPSKKK